MKTWHVVIIIFASLFGLAACANPVAVPGAGTQALEVSDADSGEPAELAATDEVTPLPPTVTALPTVVPTVPPTPTPDTPPLWVWAWTQDPAQIVAISTDGQTNILMDAPDPAAYNNASLWQVAPEKAIAMYVDGSTPIAFLLTTTGATELTFPPVRMTVPENAWTLVATSELHAVIKYQYGIAEAAVLINTDTAEATLLAPDVADMTPAARFSADGRYLRFVTTDSNMGTPSQVVERDLTTGQDRTLYSYANFDHVYTDETGDIWLDFRIGVVTVADGRPTNPQPPRNTDISRRLVGDWIVFSEYDCEQDCPLTLSPVFNSEPERTYLLPEKVAGLGISAWLLEDQSLLVFQNASSQYWRLTSDGQAEFVGQTDPFGLVTTIISTDAGEPVTYDAMVDTRTGDIMPLPFATENASDLWVDRSPNGLILTQFAPDGSQPTWVMPSDSQTFSELPVDDSTNCYTLLADGNVICQTYDPPGLLRFEPATSSLTRIADLDAYFLALAH